MLSRVEYSVSAPAPPERLWEAFADLERLLNREIYSEVVWTEGPPWKEGSRVRYTVIQPRSAVISAVVTLAEPPNRVTLLNHALGITAEQVVTFTKKKDGGTRVTMTLDFVGTSEQLPPAEVVDAIRFLTQDALDTMLVRMQERPSA